MTTRITARNFDLADGLRKHVDAEVEKLKRYYDGITDTHVVLSIENNRPEPVIEAEIVLSVYKQTLSAKNAAPTHRLAVDACFDRLRRQLLKYKAKLRRTDTDTHR